MASITTMNMNPTMNNPTTNPTNNTSTNTIKAIPKNGKRHTLQPLNELRLEIPPSTNCTLTLLSGSAEIFGCELATLTSASSSGDPVHLSKQTYVITGHAKFAVFTWHGCVVDVDVEFGKELGIGNEYVCGKDETVANVAFVNTHAQLEAMRDEALTNMTNAGGNAGSSADGPRVLVVGPADCGKTSLVKVLTSYAVKLGRTPLLIDLDTSQNMLSTPGTITAAPMNIETITPLTNATNTIYQSATPLVLWNGSTDVKNNPDLYKAQLDHLGQCIQGRFKFDTDSNSSSTNIDESIMDARSSGIIVNGCGWIEDVGYELMLYAVKALKINVVLVMGHDRLYSMLNSHYNSLREKNNSVNMNVDMDMDPDMTLTSDEAVPKVIKLPRSGGVVSRDVTYRRVARSLCMKRYFYGESIRNTNPGAMPSSSGSGMAMGMGMNMGMGMGMGSQSQQPLDADVICPPTSAASSTSTSASALVHQYTPTLLEIPFSDLTLYKLSSVSLSASMLPVSAKQATDPVQLTPVEIGPLLKHGILAVCHPNAEEKFKYSGEARDLYLSGVSGLVAVEKVDVDREIISLLSPGGSLPSNTLLVGDITWME